MDKRYGFAIFWVVALGMVFSLWAYLTRERSLTIRAGRVEEVGTHQLRSSFTIEKPSITDLVTGNYRRSHGQAGACMMALASPHIPDLSPANCGQNLPLGWFGYSIDGQCWFRGPDADYCTKSSPDNAGNPWLEGTYVVPFVAPGNVEAMYDEIKRRGKEPKVVLKWATQACLNPVDPNNKTNDVLTCKRDPGPPPLKVMGEPSDVN